MLYVLVLGDLPKPDKGETVIVACGPGNEPLAHAMGAAAGLKTTTVPPGGHAHYELVSSGEPKRQLPQIATGLLFDATVLRSLVPEAKIIVGSLQHNMPSVDWIADPGGMVVELPSKKPPIAATTMSQPEPKKYKPVVPKAIVVRVSELPKPPLGVRGPVMRVALDSMVVRGVPIREGDVVLDASSRKWYVRDRALWSHKPVEFQRAEIVIEGRTIRPLRAGTKLGAGVKLGAGAMKGEKVEVSVIGAQSQTLYGVVTDDDPILWRITTDINHSMVSDPRATCFGARLAHTAAECYAAGGVWDRPCDTDTECPYYDPATGRGKCVSGMCEMPLKVGNMSFRTADPKTPVLYDHDQGSPYTQVPGSRPIFEAYP
jgi:hypothetical protein